MTSELSSVVSCPVLQFFSFFLAILFFPSLQVIYMGVVLYAPALALNAGKSSIFLLLFYYIICQQLLMVLNTVHVVNIM